MARSDTGQPGALGRPQAGQPLGIGVEAGEPAGGGEVGHMRDQRIERRAPLGHIKTGHRLAIRGIRAEAVDRLGREGDQPTPLKAGRGAGRGGRIGHDHGRLG
jgi:hypothetical protein